MATKSKSGIGSFIVLALVVGLGVVVVRGGALKNPNHSDVHLHAEWEVGVARSLRFQVHGAPATWVAGDVLRQKTWDDGVGVWDMVVSYTEGATYSVAVEPPTGGDVSDATCSITVDGRRMAYDKKTGAVASCVIPQKH